MKPILFNTDMVRALLANRKTATRRVVKGYALEHLELDTDGSIIGVYDQSEGYVRPILDYAPYLPGDILYVRETWYYETFYEDTDGTPDLPSGNRSWRYVYKADKPDYPVIPGHWQPSIHMPREAARIFLRVTDVRVERLQDMSREDAVFEGCDPTLKDIAPDLGYYRIWNEMKSLWDSTIKPADRTLYGWEANPWVWVIEFERISREEAEHGETGIGQA